MVLTPHIALSIPQPPLRLSSLRPRPSGPRCLRAPVPLSGRVKVPRDLDRGRGASLSPTPFFRRLLFFLFLFFPYTSLPSHWSLPNFLIQLVLLWEFCGTKTLSTFLKFLFLFFQFYMWSSGLQRTKRLFSGY